MKRSYLFSLTQFKSEVSEYGWKVEKGWEFLGNDSDDGIDYSSNVMDNGDGLHYW